MPVKKQCPICHTTVPESEKECPVCGARHFADEEPEVRPAGAVAESGRTPFYNPSLGEDDLYLPRVLRLPWWSIALPLLGIGVIVLVIGFLAGAAIFRPAGSGEMTVTPPGGRTAVPTALMGGGGAATATPTMFWPTLTQPPPPTSTPTPTETPGPCEQTVQSGDNLISLATRCGHRDLDVIDEILELNGLRSAESLQLGQLLLIPWPTPTPGLPETSGDSTETSGGQGEAPENTSSGSSMAISDTIPTATLQPGVMWYRIRKDDNIIAIAVQHNANIEILSQLNPEVTFSQCDFGMDSGGANCIVQLVEGQMLRVPAPTATPTLSPTPSGSETPTPTATPTFNAPSLLSPGDRSLFRANEIVTLRWVSTGVLEQGDVYLVTVVDTTLQKEYTVVATDTLLIVPAEWRPQDGRRHTFTWSVAVGPSNGRGGLNSIAFSTASRLFFWDSP